MVACAAAAAGVVVVVRGLLDRAWPGAGIHAQLLIGLTAPAGVILFAALTETLGGVVGESAGGRE